MDLEYSISYRKKDGNYQAIISYKDNNEKWKQKSKQGFKAQKDAKPFIKQALNEIELQLKNEANAINKEYNSITFRDVANAFVEHSRLYLEHNTIKGYKNSIVKFKQLEDKAVMDLKKADIVKCVDEMIRSNLKTVTIKTYLIKLKQIFLYYKENYNPNFQIDLNIKLSKDKNIKEKKALTKIELNSLLNNLKLKKSKFYIVAYIAGKCGLRCGEILGLTWDNIDEKNMTLEVNKQWKVLKNSKSNFGDLKSKNSNRKIPITPNILKTLKQYKKDNCISIDNRIAPFNKASIEKYLNPLLRELAGISIHELRHTYATLLISNGIDFKTAAKILGHTVEMTLKIYSHVTDDMMKNASDKISRIF
ncbi:tyrosine recombinase XerD [Clostridium saccharobutylicum]|uniref:site-specific integrase n=1 Tax=Clostridium saccharobutylicum TaxID=169679 RepID=UPI000983EED4|nr:site-specific integrase [Clostridium saccharobutylicum]AQS10616.1 tyrosine recombinase XerD [Clostridium saccharobutylicum]MBC2438032.1 site-specific integrase [Clostridium saccharobutylicum]NSB90516.1 integrase [Clostridium saccharobutylicum]NYC31570.1 integrase [Clostridium saccharobutylicum]OOM18889.1 tyrosine recombinase XerD [Clostridium saccharobutylicum]